MKIRPVGAKLFHVDRQTDRWTDKMKMMVAFQNFANVSKRYVTVTKLSFHSGNDSLIYTKLLVQMYKNSWNITLHCTVPEHKDNTH
jgi:hypothetical protein